MIEVRQTEAYVRWISRLRDRQARARINIRVRRLSLGISETFGRSAGASLRFASITAPGYRVYFIHRGPVLVILLAGGDKSSQRRDITRARDLAREL